MDMNAMSNQSREMIGLRIPHSLRLELPQLIQLWEMPMLPPRFLHQKNPAKKVPKVSLPNISIKEFNGHRHACDTTKLENFREESDDHESSTQSYQRVPAAYMYPSDIPSNNLNESHTYNGTHSEDDCQPYRLTIDRVHCKVYTRAKLRPFRNWKYPAAQAFLTPHRDNRCR